MPTSSYHDFLIKELLDPEYSALYIETALEETIKDGDMQAFVKALRNVLEAVEKKQTLVEECYRSRQQTYRMLVDSEDLTLESAIAALKVVGINPEAGLLETQLVRGA